MRVTEREKDQLENRIFLIVGMSPLSHGRYLYKAVGGYIPLTGGAFSFNRITTLILTNLLDHLAL